MNISTKFAIVFVCAAICALAVSLIANETAPTKPVNHTTPVKLREAQRAHWLLV